MGELNQLDFRERLNLASSNKMPSRNCWLDGTECPYGRPEGKFIFRPVVFCRMPRGKDTGCAKLADKKVLIEIFYEQVISDEIAKLRWYINPDELEADVVEQEMLLSDKIREIAEKLPDSDREALERAAEILEKAEGSNIELSNLNPEIVESSVIDSFL